MKVAFPTNDDKGLDSSLSAEYAHCKYFLIASLDNGKPGKYEIIPNFVPGNVVGERGAVAFMLSGKGVEAVIVHKIHEKDRLSLVGNSIRIFLGASGTASEAIKQYFDGKLTENSQCKSGDVCDCC